MIIKYLYRLIGILALLVIFSLNIIAADTENSSQKNYSASLWNSSNKESRSEFNSKSLKVGADDPNDPNNNPDDPELGLEEEDTPVGEAGFLFFIVIALIYGLFKERRKSLYF